MKTKAILALFACLLATSSVVPAASASPGAKPVDDLTSQETYITLVNFNSGKCLGATGGTMTNGTKIVQWTCNGNPDQYWSQVPIGDGSYHELRNFANPNKCLGVPGGSTSQGVQLVIWDCNRNSDQFWTEAVPGDGCLAIVNLHSGLIIGVASGSTANEAAVVQWRWQGHRDQRWC